LITQVCVDLYFAHLVQRFKPGEYNMCWLMWFAGILSFRWSFIVAACLLF